MYEHEKLPWLWDVITQDSFSRPLLFPNKFEMIFIRETSISRYISDLRSPLPYTHLTAKLELEVLMPTCMYDTGFAGLDGHVGMNGLRIQIRPILASVIGTYHGLHALSIQVMAVPRTRTQRHSAGHWS